jgi:hypothetical protein
MCALTADETEAPLFHPAAQPSERDRLKSAGRLLVNAIATAPKPGPNVWVGRLSDADLLRLDLATPVLLGLAASPRTRDKREE